MKENICEWRKNAINTFRSFVASLSLFLNQARADRPAHAWFLIITFVRESMRVCMWVYAPKAINN